MSNRAATDLLEMARLVRLVSGARGGGSPAQQPAPAAKRQLIDGPGRGGRAPARRGEGARGRGGDPVGEASGIDRQISRAPR